MPDPLASRRLGRYEIQQEIGRGGMARVYRALDTLLRRTVALKILSPQLSHDPEFAGRFEREAVTAANLRHPAIITIFDVGEAEGLRYIAMEYIGGSTLATALAQHGAFALPLAVALTQPVAEALDAAHRLGAVHRDIKPQNILLDTDGRVLLTDFGIALGPQQGGERLTRAGSFMGTPEYLSPEQVQEQQVTSASDLYTLAVVAFELLTGRLPFEGTTPQLIMAHALTAPPQITAVAPQLPPELDAIFARALAKQPDARYGRATDFVAALRAVAAAHKLPDVGPQAIAALTQPGQSSAGSPTIALTAPPTDRAPAPTAAPSPIEEVFGRPQPATRSPIDEVFAPPPARAGRTTPPASVPPPVPPAQPAGRQPNRAGRQRVVYPHGGDIAPPRRVRPVYANEGRMAIPWPLIMVVLIVAVLIALLVVETSGRNRGNGTNGGLGAVFAGGTATSLAAAATSATPVAGAAQSTGEPPTPVPTSAPGAPTPEATAVPPGEPTVAPITEVPAPITVPTTTPAPTLEPTAEPTVAPTVEPTTEPTTTTEPTATVEPTAVPPTSTPFGRPTPIGDGATIVFQFGDAINLFDVAGGTETELQADAQPVGPAAISPDGSTVLFDALVDEQRQIFQWTRANGRIAPYTQPNGDAYHPAWSPDGSRVVYAGNAEGDADIYVVETDGIRRLTSDPADDDYPSWTPDGAQIVWESVRGDQWGVYLMNLGEGTEQQIVAPVVGANDRYPRISPDGSQVVFASDRDRADGGFELYVQSLAGAEPVRVTTLGSGSASGPQWSPDGRMILFFSDQNGTDDMYAVRLDDGAIIPIRNTDAQERWPIWGK